MYNYLRSSQPLSGWEAPEARWKPGFSKSSARIGKTGTERGEEKAPLPRRERRFFF